MTSCCRVMMTFSTVGPVLVLVSALMISRSSLFVIVLSLFLVVALFEPGLIMIRSHRVTP